MTLGIMQPYFFPYIGYFQLMQAVDTFVIYDNIEFTKKGWINRNRYLQNGKDQLFSLPLKKDSDFLDIKQRHLADSFTADKEKLKRQVAAAYAKAPYFAQGYPVFVECLDFADTNLFNFIFHSLKKLANFLSIDTKLVVSSEISEPEALKGQDRVLWICKEFNATHYINSIGGKELYSKADFRKAGVELSFIKTNPITYAQFSNEFVPNLSILDVMMFNSAEAIKGMLGQYELV